MQSKKVVLLLSFFVFTFYSCENGVSSVDELVDVQVIRTELSSRFLNLEQALHDAGMVYVDPQTFKHEAIKHLLKVDTNSEAYKLISQNYDAAYARVTLDHRFRNNAKEEAFMNEKMGELTTAIENASTYDATRAVFENFYHTTQNDAELSNEQKNYLSTVVAWYEASLDFYEGNHQLFVQDSQSVAILDLQLKGCGWWRRWGKCAAGTLGGYFGGGLTGCGVGGGFGSLAAGVGAIPGCIAGGIVGAVSGALTGAATFCDGCNEN